MGKKLKKSKEELSRSCVWCGKKIPPDRISTSITCSREHYNMYYNDKKKQKRKKSLIEKNSNKICLYCGEKMPPHKRADSKCCCQEHTLLYYKTKNQSGVKICERCGKKHGRKKSVYCSEFCKTKTWKEENRKKINKSERENRKEKFLKKRKKLFEEKELFCRWCSSPIPINSTKTKYCDEHCKQQFNSAKQAKKPVKIKVDYKTTIETTSYDQITKIRVRYIEHLNLKPKNIQQGGRKTKKEKGNSKKEFAEKDFKKEFKKFKKFS